MPSFEKINYLLRPSKQIERKLIIESLQRLTKANYFVQDYTYLGMGSVYYADFVLFHKYLSIEQMICAEDQDVQKRMEFNKPYSFVRLHAGPISEVFPELDRTQPHLVWLDYDYPLNEFVIRDVRSCLAVLAPKSIFLVTVSADPKNLVNLLKPKEAAKMTPDQQREASFIALNELLREHLGRDLKAKDTSRINLPKIYVEALHSLIATTLSNGSGLEFFQLFNYQYADGLTMITMGGVIDDANTAARLESSSIYNFHGINSTITPTEISVPLLTLREKDWLEQKVVKQVALPEFEFEMDQAMVDNFVLYYKHYPTYYETLV